MIIITAPMMNASAAFEMLPVVIRAENSSGPVIPPSRGTDGVEHGDAKRPGLQGKDFGHGQVGGAHAGRCEEEGDRQSDSQGGGGQVVSLNSSAVMIRSVPESR